MVFRSILITILFASTFGVSGQVQVSGIVFDKNTGETLIGATVLNSASGKGTTTNHYGQFYIEITPQDSAKEILVSYVGYTTFKQLIDSSGLYQVFLEPCEIELSEVVISSEKGNKPNNKIGAFTLNTTELNKTPSFSGETDLIDILTRIPGVAITGDGNSILNVRGGSSDQNLFLIDDMPLYYVSHLGGLLSTFNTDIIKTVDFYKNGFPSNYGNRLSSIVDVRTKDGNMKEYEINGTLGLISSKLSINGPIIKNKASFLVSTRINTIPIFKWIWDLGIGYRFSDSNMKLNYIISPKDRVYFSYYRGKDRVSFQSDLDLGYSYQDVSWGNSAGSLRYTRVLGNKLFGSLLLGITTYKYDNSIESSKELGSPESDDYSYLFSSSISDAYCKYTIEYYPISSLKILSGYEFAHHRYTPGTESLHQSRPDTPEVNWNGGFPKIRAQEHNLFVHSELNNKGFSLNAGTRISVIPIYNETHFLAEPRLIVSQSLGNFAFSAAFDWMHQSFHTLYNQGTGIPIEYRIPVLQNAPPEQSRMLSAMASFMPSSKPWMFKIEVYRKALSNLVTLKEGVRFTSANDEIESLIWTNGTGHSKGIEFMVKKHYGRFKGWVGATFSETTRSFAEINAGESYSFKYDRPMEYKMNLSYEITKSISFAATWVYGSGIPLSIPVGQYIDNNEVILIYGKRNSVRSRPYHRLDIGVTFTRSTKWGSSIWRLSVVNLYNRKNPYYYYSEFDNGFKGTGDLLFYEQSLIPLMPSISYSFIR